MIYRQMISLWPRIAALAVTRAQRDRRSGTKRIPFDYAALQWSDVVYDQIETLAESPESNGLSAENDEFPYEIRDKLIGLGSRPIPAIAPSSQLRTIRSTS